MPVSAMLFVAALAYACPGTTPDPGPLGPVRAGHSLYVDPVEFGELRIDGALVKAHSIERLDHPVGAGLPEVWRVDEALVAGGSWSYTYGEQERKGRVLGAVDAESFELLSVAHGSRNRGSGCMNSADYRDIDVDISEVTGTVALIDVDYPQVVRSGHVVEALSLDYSREGYGIRTTCLQALWLDPAGVTHDSDVVCSTDQESGCNTTGSAATGLLVLLGLGSLRRRTALSVARAATLSGAPR